MHGGKKCVGEKEEKGKCEKLDPCPSEQKYEIVLSCLFIRDAKFVMTNNFQAI